MAETIHSVLRALHISMGFLGLAMFWIPAFAPKGRRVHIAAGKVFSLCARTVALTALGSSSWVFIHPSSWVGRPVTLSQIPADQVMFIAILGLLAIFLLQGVENGMRAVRTRQQPETFGSTRLRSLNLAQVSAGVAVFLFGAYHIVAGSGVMFWIPVALGAASVADFFEHRKFFANPRPTPMAWWYKHMDGMVGSGIAFHTAFLVFGAQNVFSGALIEGTWSFLPWVLPTALGLPALHFWTRYYKKKFGELPARVTRESAVQS